MKDERIATELRPFMDRLEGLGPGERAKLRRNAGRSLAESRYTLGLFYRLAPRDLAGYDRDTYFLVATLYPLADAGGTGNLGAALARARTDDSGKGLDRRVEVLLDSDRSQLAFRLRQAIRLLKGRGVKIDWIQLLADLLEWNLPSRSVQEQWARSYFTQHDKTQSKGKE